MSWLGGDGTNIALLRYEDLIVDPRGSVERIVSSFLPELVPIANALIPSFPDLHRIDPSFFRHGAVGSHQTELSSELEELFLAQPENATAMQHLGDCATHTA